MSANAPGAFIVDPNAVAALTDISSLGLVPCTTSGLSFCENNGTPQSDGLQVKVTYYRAYVAAFDFSAPRLMFVNHFWNGGGGQNGEHPGPGPIILTASISTDFASTTGTPSKNFVPVTFGGRPSYSLAGGKIVFSDPVPISWKMDECFIVRTCVSATPGTQWPLCSPSENGPVIVTITPSAYGRSGYLNGQDSTQTAGAVPANTGTQANLYGPAAMFAAPAANGLPGVACIGDSIARGFGDDYPGYQDAQVYYEGFVTRALHNTGHGVVQIGTGGDTVAFFIQRGWTQYRRLMITNCKHAVVATGRNDLSNSVSAATLEANLVVMWRHIASWGLKVWGTTIPPRASSTDGFITVLNQTTDATNTARVAVNTWIRGGAPIDPATKLPVAVGTGGALVAGVAGHPLTGVFDVATPMESAQDSGKWVVPQTGTGDTNSNGTITNATGGPWSKGMLINASAGLGASMHIFSVSGSTLTLDNVPSNQVGVTIAGLACTADGIHPSPQGNYLGSAAITPASFT